MHHLSLTITLLGAIAYEALLKAIAYEALLKNLRCQLSWDFMCAMTGYRHFQVSLVFNHDSLLRQF